MEEEPMPVIREQNENSGRNEDNPSISNLNGLEQGPNAQNQIIEEEEPAEISIDSEAEIEF